MAKRFTATDKWNRPWFRKLPWRYKLFWLFILDSCEISGVWLIDFETANVRIGARIDPGDALLYLEKQVVFINDDRWFIKDYPAFQYSTLNPQNNFHRSVILNLEKNCVPTKFWQGLLRPSPGPAQALNTHNKEQETKNKNTGDTLFGEPEHRRMPFKKPTIHEVVEYCAERKNAVDAEKWLNYYESNGWRVGRNPMKNWKAAVRTWEKSGFNNAAEGGYDWRAPIIPAKH